VLRQLDRTHIAHHKRAARRLVLTCSAVFSHAVPIATAGVGTPILAASAVSLVYTLLWIWE
jgi:hypothetical protein